jgi:hypothetical protein
MSPSPASLACARDLSPHSGERKMGASGWAKSMPLEKLHGALVLLRRRAAGEGAEIAPPAGLRIDFARIEPVFAGGELADHGQRS